MNKEDYKKFYIQGSDHYLIPKDVFKELFNEMINWKEENKILKENAENNDKVVDKVNWKNQLLKKENEQLKEEIEEYKNPIKYFKYANKNVTEENKQLKDNWIKLRQKMIDSFNKTQDVQFLDILQDMQELEQGSDSND